MNVYLAGPIDLVDDKGKGWRDELIELCKGHHTVLLYSPQTPFSFSRATPDISKFIHDVNMEALNRCDAIVARLMRNQASVGTPIEIYEAVTKLRKPTVVVTDMADSVYMQYIGIYGHLVKDINEAYGMILKLDKKHEDHKARFAEGGNGSANLKIPAHVLSERAEATLKREV